MIGAGRPERRNRMKHKILAAVLALALVLTMLTAFVACGGKTDENPPKKDNTEQTDNNGQENNNNNQNNDNQDNNNPNNGNENNDPAGKDPGDWEPQN